MAPDYFLVEWDSFLLSSNINTKRSYKTFVKKFEFLLDIYIPLKNSSKNKLKFKDKPWILVYKTLHLLKTSSCQNLLNLKLKILVKKKKRKPTLDTSNTNLLSTLLKKNKQFYFPRLFQENIKDLKTMWRGIKKIISSNNSNHIFPTAITVYNQTITDPSDIADAFKF